MTKEFVPFGILVEEVKNLCNAKSTGTLFAVTKKNNSLQMQFDNGKIKAITFKNEHGKNALEKIININAVHYRFMKGFLPKRKELELPDTDEILFILNSFADEKASENINYDLQNKEDIEQNISKEKIEILENILTEYVGPMASLLCEEYCEKHCDLKTLVDKLAEEIPNEEHSFEFKQKCEKEFKL